MSGIINISKLKIPPDKHELETARYFAELGYDIEFIPPNYTPKMHTPDIVMDGVAWEIKSPIGRGKRTIELSLRQAVKQSHNIIFDLRRANLPESACLTQLEKQFQLKSYIKRLYIIKRNGELIKLSR